MPDVCSDDPSSFDPKCEEADREQPGFNNKTTRLLNRQWPGIRHTAARPLTKTAARLLRKTNARLLKNIHVIKTRVVFVRNHLRT